ncbi:XkdW family protein [Cytobacillus praedii]|uniref:Uncharacterized protein n=1 Tax=Cytobacillus praedii TaxID=1742358 RepID=A0A4R1B1X2_9BACI|nr:XkdW family protein [Cytobacillus praedii]TCJ04084.1 hypothetical protein E0Y62_11615 [Cytobacillus praedii]
MEWETFTNVYGEWKTNGIINVLVKPSQKWYEENPSSELEPPLPSPTDLLAEELVKLKFDNMQKDVVISSLGEEITKLKFELMALKEGA